MSARRISAARTHAVCDYGPTAVPGNRVTDPELGACERVVLAGRRPVSVLR